MTEETRPSLDQIVDIGLKKIVEQHLIAALRNPSPELLRALAEAQFQAHVQSARDGK